MTEQATPEPSRSMSVLPVDDLAEGMGYKLMTALIVPRPIGWIGSVSASGVPNLAPFRVERP